MTRAQKGQTLIELLATTSIIGILSVAGFSSFGRTHRNVALAGATSELRAIFQQVRMTAIVRNRNVAIRFQQLGGKWHWSVYEDGDGDGVRNNDIASGIDVRIQRPRLFQHGPAGIGIPLVPIPDPVNGEPLGLRLPVRFGTSMLCSFSRAGEATNGSVVLTNGLSATVIHVNGHSALIRVSRWNGKSWRSGV